MKINKKAILILITLLVLGGLVFYSFAKEDTVPSPDETDLIEEDQFGTDREPLQVEVITAEHTYEDGMHTISGKVDLPTPCYGLLVEAEVRESSPEQVALIFSQLGNTSSDLVCAQVITPRTFKVSFAASAEAQIIAQTGNEALDFRLVE